MDYSNKNIFIFDFDMTLAESKSQIDLEMAKILVELSASKKVVVVSGSNIEVLQKNLVNVFVENNLHENFKNLILLPSAGSRMYSFDGNTWQLVYKNDLTQEQKDKIITNLNVVIKKYSLDMLPSFGERIEDRYSEIAYSALGQSAPIEMKKNWDPDESKRKPVVEDLKKIFDGEFNVEFGGSTTIDITLKGVDKGYGVEKLLGYLSLDKTQAVFVGDRLEPDGNDYPVFKIGVDCVATTGPEMTKKIIKNKFLLKT